MNFAHRTFRRGSATASLTLGGAMLGFELDFLIMPGTEHPRIGCGSMSSTYTVQNVLAEYTCLTPERFSRIFAPEEKGC